MYRPGQALVFPVHSVHEGVLFVSSKLRPLLRTVRYYRYSFLGHNPARRVMLIKNSNCLIGNRTCEIPACSAVLKGTAPPRVPGT